MPSFCWALIQVYSLIKKRPAVSQAYIFPSFTPCPLPRPHQPLPRPHHSALARPDKHAPVILHFILAPREAPTNQSRLPSWTGATAPSSRVAQRGCPASWAASGRPKISLGIYWLYRLTIGLVLTDGSWPHFLSPFDATR